MVMLRAGSGLAPNEWDFLGREWLVGGSNLIGFVVSSRIVNMYLFVMTRLRMQQEVPNAVI